VIVYIDKLPNDALNHILADFTLREIHALEKVCKKFKDLIAKIGLIRLM
jgi:hypothetical protein